MKLCLTGMQNTSRNLSHERMALKKKSINIIKRADDVVRGGAGI